MPLSIASWTIFKKSYKFDSVGRLLIKPCWLLVISANQAWHWHAQKRKMSVPRKDLHRTRCTQQEVSINQLYYHNYLVIIYIFFTELNWAKRLKHIILNVNNDEVITSLWVFSKSNELFKEEKIAGTEYYLANPYIPYIFPR